MAKILIVDDEPRIRDLIREHLQYAGFVCEEAGDGGAALAVLGYSGSEVAAALKGIDMDALPLEEIIRQALKRMVK